MLLRGLVGLFDPTITMVNRGSGRPYVNLLTPIRNKAARQTAQK